MDLKPDNILIKGNILKISDFGNSKEIKENEENGSWYFRQGVATW